MDPNVLNYIVVASMATFAMALGGLLWALGSLVPQVNKTLNAYERLAGTLEDELTPTLREVSKVVAGVTELKTVAVKNVTDVQAKVEDVSGNLTRVAETAKKQSSVWGTGFLAGVRAYLEAKPSSDKDHKQDGKKVSVAANRGD